MAPHKLLLLLVAELPVVHTNIQFNNGGSFSGESTLTWNYDTDALTVSGNTLMAGTGVILDVKTTGGTTLFAVEDTTE